ncbi:predicted protein [Histoplasma capsulatum var. duboisii H88]|uniref:Predicted protein n=1 Tax=Ajellomyces capsulatus (strain H88) TaxID=544711 RepID=F0U904_AJEC8|nr:predicted protein [Histoplasma capsulatum var. duboisii H88]
MTASARIIAESSASGHQRAFRLTAQISPVCFTISVSWEWGKSENHSASTGKFPNDTFAVDECYFLEDCRNERKRICTVIRPSPDSSGSVIGWLPHCNFTDRDQASAVCKKEAKTGGRRLMATNGPTMDIDGGKLTGLRMDHRNSVFNRSATNCFRGLFPPRNKPPPHARCVESSLLNHQLGRIRYDSASTSRGGSDNPTGIGAGKRRESLPPKKGATQQTRCLHYDRRDEATQGGLIRAASEGPSSAARLHGYMVCSKLGPSHTSWFFPLRWATETQAKAQLGPGYKPRRCPAQSLPLSGLERSDDLPA